MRPNEDVTDRRHHRQFEPVEPVTMKTAASVVALCVVAALCAWSSTPASAHPNIARSLRERCRSEPVAVDHLSCVSVSRTAYQPLRRATNPSRRPMLTVHRHRKLVAAHRVTPKLLQGQRNLRVASALSLINRKQQQHHAPLNCHPAAGFRASAAHHPSTVGYGRHVPPAAVRRHQASAFCGHPAHRTSWECQRYFLLAPQGVKSR